MKKIIIILSIISILFIVNNKNEIVIPKESIRFRIIANSNTFEDQSLKNIIKKDLINNVFSTLPNNYNKSKNLIINSIPLIENTLNKYNIKYNINFGNNYFPEKKYKGITYPSGNYESLVITLDRGLGDNFWCVMYPPLCLVEQDNDYNNIEYKSFIKEILDKYNT